MFPVIKKCQLVFWGGETTADPTVVGIKGIPDFDQCRVRERIK